MMTIPDILKLRGIELKKKKGAGSEEYSSPCPKCQGKDRFTYWSETDTFFCRGCSSSGGLVKFFMQIDGLSEQEALREYFICRGLNDDEAKKAAHNAMKKQRGATTKKARPARTRVEENNPAPVVDLPVWRQKAAALVEWAHQNLLKNQAALTWLSVERGISLETVKRCKLGWNPAALFRSRGEWGLREELSKNGKPKKVWIAAGLVIPGFNSGGVLSRVKIRQPDDQRPPGADAWVRYVEVSGSQKEFVYFGQIRRALIVVESELDAVLIEQEAGRVITSVSTGSASNRARNKADIETLSKAARVLVSLDNDEAGAKSAVRSWQQFESSRLWLVPADFGKDHTEAKKNGLPLREWIEIGLDLPEAIKDAVRLIDVAGAADRAEIQNALNTIETCRDPDDYNFALSVLGGSLSV